MHDLDTRAGSGPRVGEECRRVAELLRLSAVGIVGDEDGRRHVAWWVAPGAEHLPSRIEDVLEGRAAGWISAPLPHGAAFARMTPGSSVHAPSALAALAPALNDALMGRAAEMPPTPELAEGPAPDLDEAGRDLSLKDADLPVLEAVAAAVRAILETPAASVRDLLDGVRRALDADELFLLQERGADIAVLGSPEGEWPRRIPPEVSSGLDDLPSVDAVADGTARQFGVVLGARTALSGAAFRTRDGHVEMILAGRAVRPPMSGAVMRLVGRMTGAGRAALESRHRAVDALMLQERTRWAFEIHDGLIQAVTSAVLELQMLRRTLERDPALAAEGLAAVEAEIRRSVGALRGMLFDLSSDGEDAVDEPLEDYVGRIAKRWKLAVDIRIEGDVAALPLRVRSAAYLVAREGLANSAKHASSKQVSVRVTVEDGGVRLEIEDAGRGFVPEDAVPKAGHLGLELMRRRITEVSGTLDIESSPGNGTRVVAWLPVGREGVTP